MKKLITLLFLIPLSVSVFATGHIPMATSTPVTCFGLCNGTANGSVTGGVGPFGYFWTGPASYSAVGTNLNGLCGGTYTLTVTDSSDMSTANTTTTVYEPTLLTANIGGGTTICMGNCLNFSGIVNGGVAPYAYNWAPSPGLSNTSVWNPTACPSFSTTYTLSVVDANGCITSATTAVFVNPLPVVTAVASPSSTICSGSQVTLTASGAITYNWSGGAFNGTPFSPASTATYTVTGTDANGCADTYSITVNVNPAPVATFTYSASPYCAGGSNPIPTYIGGGAPGTFTSTPGLVFIGASTGAIDVAASAPGTYVVTNTIAATGGCPGATATATISISSPSISLSSTNETCNGLCDGIITANITGGAAPYTYLWNTGSTAQTQINLCSGNYTVMIADVAGCMDTASVILTSPPPATANFSIIPDSTDGYSIWTYNSSSGNSLIYNWNFDDGMFSNAQSPAHIYSIPATYNVCLYLSSLACNDTVCHSITITGPTPASCLSLFNAARNTFNSNDYTITNLSYGANLTYLWDFGDGNTSNAQLPSHNYSGTGPYQVCLTVDNGAGCTNTYCDSLFAVDSLGHSVLQPISFTVVDGPAPTTVGIHNQSLVNTTITVAPNPFIDNTVFTINSSNQNETYSFEMKDVLGKTIKSINEISNKQFSVSRTGIENGIYFYEIYNHNGIIGKGKLIIK